ncbi:MAG: CRISPR-associated primase-polymerase type B [Succinivibrionaceae bacterium]|nr:hypothetical protein [Succinivibrionaceae bacterium]MDY3145620.1 CRISPR-associated primase-polymerase type B [Succinivibrionaceae bacterium]
MIMLGSSIQAPADRLQKVQEEYLLSMLRHPGTELASLVQSLRGVGQADRDRHEQLKKKLPYAVCGIFNPRCRRKENFAYTERFIIEIGHLAAKGLSLEDVRQQINADRDVMLSFASPGRDGLKVMLALRERCYDAGLYSIFYAKFAQEFARRHGLEGAVDSLGSDVMQACFVSPDEEAYFNPDAEKVCLGDYVDTANPDDVFRIRHEDEEYVKAIKKAASSEPKAPSDPDKDILEAIRKKLSPAAKARRAKPAADPEKLEKIADELRKEIEETGIEVTDIVGLPRARKIQARLGARTAEVSIFQGKDSFTVVFSPRSGTDGELNRLLADMVKNFLSNMD